MAGTRLCSWLLLAALLSFTLVTVCEAARLPSFPSQAGNSAVSNSLLPLQYWLRSLRAKIGSIARKNQQKDIDRPRRSCTSFSCIRNQVGHSMSQHAIMKSLIRNIMACANDPSCSPGKRVPFSGGSPGF